MESTCCNYANCRFGSPHDIVTKDDIHIRHFEQRRTWAVGGIHRIRNQDDFQFFVLHNSWLPSVHIKRYVMPQYRFGATLHVKQAIKAMVGKKKKFVMLLQNRYIYI